MVTGYNGRMSLNLCISTYAITINIDEFLKMNSLKNEKILADEEDPESQEIPEHGVLEDSKSFSGVLKKLTTAGVEMRGIDPIPIEKRNHTKYYNIFTLFGGSFLSVLP